MSEPGTPHPKRRVEAVAKLNEAGIPTMVGGYLTTNNEVNTMLAAGRADLCIMNLPAHL